MQERVPDSDLLFETDVSGKESIDIAPAFSPQFSSYVARMGYVSVPGGGQISFQAKQQGADSFDTSQSNYNPSSGSTYDIGTYITMDAIDTVGRYYIYDPQNPNTPTTVEGQYGNPDQNETKFGALIYTPEAALEGLRFRASDYGDLREFTGGWLRVYGIE